MTPHERAELWSFICDQEPGGNNDWFTVDDVLDWTGLSADRAADVEEALNTGVHPEGLEKRNGEYRWL